MSEKAVIPLRQPEYQAQESIIHGLEATIFSLKQSFTERMKAIENKIDLIDKKKIPDNTEDILLIKKELTILSNLFLKIDELKTIISSQLSDIYNSINTQIDTLADTLNSNIAVYFKASQDLYDKFKIIENNLTQNFIELKNFIQAQPSDPLDYLFLTENFNKQQEAIKGLKTDIETVIKNKITNKYENPYICEVVFKKDLPIAEFSNYGKAIVYKSGLLKNKIGFYKNTGKEWIEVK
jgi:hypothetical protein